MQRISTLQSQVKFLLIRKHEICFWSQSLRISFLSLDTFFVAVVALDTCCCCCCANEQKLPLELKQKSEWIESGQTKNFFNLHKIASRYKEDLMEHFLLLLGRCCGASEYKINNTEKMHQQNSDLSFIKLLLNWTLVERTPKNNIKRNVAQHRSTWYRED